MSAELKVKMELTKCVSCDYQGHSLEPLLDVVEHVHGDGGDHADLLGVILEDEHHVEVLQLKLDSLEVNQLDVLQGNHQGGLKMNTSHN